jgi:hypothetical protein
MIKNWKLFLESNDDNDGGIFENTEELKLSLRGLISPLLISELIIRSSGDKQSIVDAVDMILGIFLRTFVFAVNDKEFSDERKELFIEIFNQSLEDSRDSFINISFIKGIDDIVDNFINKLEKMKKEAESEDEEWREEKEKDYSELSKSELNNLIDNALDNRDFEKVKMLSKYLKESVSVDSKEILENLCYDICELFIKYIYKYI